MNSVAKVSKILRPNMFSLASMISSLRVLNSPVTVDSTMFANFALALEMNSRFVSAIIFLPSFTNLTFSVNRSCLSWWKSLSSVVSCSITKSSNFSKFPSCRLRSSRNSVISFFKVSITKVSSILACLAI